MAALASRRIRRAQPSPGEALAIDWSNPITRDMVLCMSHADAAYGFASGAPTILPYTSGAQANTPQGTGGRCSSAPLYIVPNAGGLNSVNYSLFAFGSCTSASVTQSALDMDNSSTRYFQFRIANGKADFIPFNTSAGVTGQATSPVAMSVTEMTRGFTMGATASAGRTAVFQNGNVTSATPTSLIAPTSAMGLGVGARVTNTQPWATGGLMLAVAWNRTLTDAEMQSLADNPWQLFKPAPRRLWLAWSASSGTTTNVNPGAGTLALTGYAPQVAQSANQSVAPGAAALTFGGYAPTVTQSVTTNVSPQAGVLTLTGFAPSVGQSANQTVSLGAGSLTLSGYAPNVARTANQAVQLGAGALTLAGYAPLITQGPDNAPRVFAATIMRITTTNRRADLGGVLNSTAPIRSTGPNVATIMSAAPVNRTADLAPATLNRTVSFP